MEILLLVLFIGLLPGIIATARGHHNQMAIWVMIIMMNFLAILIPLLLIAWPIGLVWACTAVRRDRAAYPTG